MNVFEAKLVCQRDEASVRGRRRQWQFGRGQTLGKETDRYDDKMKTQIQSEPAVKIRNGKRHDRGGQRIAALLTSFESGSLTGTPVESHPLEHARRFGLIGC